MDLNKKYEKIILDKYSNEIKEIDDLLAGEDANSLSLILITLFGYLLKDDSDETISKYGIKIRKYINYIIRKIGPSFLMVPQVMEDRNLLSKTNNYSNQIQVPSSPVIWASNHAFKDDTLASIIAIPRNAYIIFGSLPQFYNTFDGFTAWLNGVIMTNRKVKNSKKASLGKAKKVMNLGTDIMMFPEGVWNKTSEKLLLDFWPGIYRIALENNVEIVPVVHYLKDCTEEPKKDNVIHTVIDDAIDISNMSEKQALEYLKEVMGTWYYLMLEKYGKSSREEEMKCYNSSIEKWENELKNRVLTAGRYDYSIETSAHYLNSKEIELLKGWSDISKITNINSNNINHVLYAKQKIKEMNDSNFQKRF